jgi:thiamine-monophosphate kinase
VLTGGRADGEFAAIELIRSVLGSDPARPAPGEVWIGDDAAVLSPVGGHLLFTTDLSVAGVHADMEIAGLDDLGWRALVAAVSDIAAMGGEPGHCVVGIAGPPETDLVLLYEGLREAGREHECPIVGGDLSNALELSLCVSVVGAVPDEPGPVLRSGARPGHDLAVTGPLGASAAGLRALRLAFDRGGRREVDRIRREALPTAHLRPRARIAAGRAARRAGVSAMVDVSDGLGADIAHLAAASGVGFDLDEVPVADGAELADALGGGEDYELVMAVPDMVRLAAEFESAGLPPPLRLGLCTDEGMVRRLSGDPLAPSGFEHRWGD